MVTRKPDMAFFGGRRPETFEPAYEDGKRLPTRERRKRTRERLQKYVETHKRKPRERSSLPEESRFEIVPPKAFANRELRELHEFLRAELETRIEAIHAERKADGKTRFLGAAAARAQDPFDSAGSSWPSFGLNSRIACKIATLRIQLLGQLKDWRARYRRAFLAWKGGERKATFPHGAWALRVYHSARVETG